MPTLRHNSKTRDEGRLLLFLAADDNPGIQQSPSRSGTQESSEERTTFGEHGSEPSGSHTAFRLRTTCTLAQLQHRLLATYRAAHSSIEEQGVNTLFLAFGMLRWRDDDALDEVHLAPLVLVPVELERSNIREGFRLKYSGDELGDNICLGEFLKQSHGIVLPELPESEDLDLSSYFQSVEAAVVSRAEWSVDRRVAVLGFFSFAKLLMYRDLHPSAWPNPDAFSEHDLLDGLLGAGTLSGTPSEFGDADFVDDHLVDRKVSQVVDADSSQTNALLDVSTGRSMVIQGPPGTGKSQTIVNLIAHAVASGKRVLFVAGKDGALLRS